MGSIVTNNCITCQALTGSNCFLTYAAALRSGKLEWHLVVGKESSLLKLIDFLETKGCSVDLKSKTYLNKKNILTSKQEKIIKIAFDKGYYDYPKGINLRELSKILNVSFSTLNEILRRGEKKIIRDYYLKKK
jgi:predicted DNA binding protein